MEKKVFVSNSSSNNKGSNNDRFVRNKAHVVFVNDQIKAPNMVIIGDDGSIVGTFPRRVALDMASEKGLDLVQMQYDPVKMVSTVKLVDYGKYSYKKQKDDKDKKKNQKSKGFKELKIGYMIGENDLLLKIKKAEELLKDGYNIKILIRLKGREKAYGETAKSKLMMVIDKLRDLSRTQYETPKKEVQGYSITLFTKVK